MNEKKAPTISYGTEDQKKSEPSRKARTHMGNPTSTHSRSQDSKWNEQYQITIENYSTEKRERANGEHRAYACVWVSVCACVCVCKLDREWEAKSKERKKETTVHGTADYVPLNQCEREEKNQCTQLDKKRKRKTE